MYSRLLAELATHEARIKIMRKILETSKKQKKLRDGYINTKIKQYKLKNRITRTTHK